MSKFYTGDLVISKKEYSNFGIRVGDRGTVVDGVLPKKDGMVSVSFTKKKKNIWGSPVTERTVVRVDENDLYLIVEGAERKAEEPEKANPETRVSFVITDKEGKAELLIGSTVAAEADIDLPHENVGDPLDAVMVLLDKLYPGRILNGPKKKPEESPAVPGFISVYDTNDNVSYISIGNITTVHESYEIAGGADIEMNDGVFMTEESVDSVMKKIAEASR